MSDPKSELRQAFDEMLQRLVRARDAIDDPSLFPPPPSERNLALGYRYLLGFLHGTIDRVGNDARFPYLQRAIYPLAKSTIDNPDALYLSAPIDPEGTYRVTGRAGDFRHWKGEPAAASGPKAPQYVIFECHTAYPGDSGGLWELSPDVRALTATLDSTRLAVAADGTFEILLAPERPAAFDGNFMATRLEAQGARYLIIRELFHDWEREESLELHIARVGSEGAPAEPLSAAAMTERLQRVGELVDNQMRFWNQFYTLVLETYRDMNGDGKQFMPRNDLNIPDLAGIQRGGGQSTNIYAGGVFELGPEDALVIELRAPVEPQFTGFHLSDFWGQSLDYANRLTSLNGFQAEREPDGAMRLVVAHRDPGVPNWLDTTGLPEGFMTARWAYSQTPGERPRTRVSKVPFAELRAKLPAATRRVPPEERRAAIALRQRHVQRRYRQF